MPSALAPAAESGFHDASAYDTYRPSYPDAAVDGLLAQLALPVTTTTPPPTTTTTAGRLQIVEIGAGTGKFTELLSRRAAAAPSGPWTIYAVEPHAQMRASLAAKNLAHVTVVDGHATALGAVADGTADAVLIAQAFHWFAHDEAMDAFHRVLKPGASVGVLWNIEDYNKPASWPAAAPWQQALNDLVLALPPDGNRRFRDGQWQQAFASAAARGRFAPLADARTEWTVQLTPDGLWKRLQTLSQVANLPDEDPADGADDTNDKPDAGSPPRSRRAVRRRMDAILAQPGVERDGQGAVTLHGVTYYAWARKI